MVQELKNLFLKPDLEQPFRMEIYDKFIHDHESYLKLARESAASKAKDDYKDFVESSIIDDEIPDYLINNIPNNMAPTNMNLNNKVLASSGVYYDKDELKKIVCTYKNPVCYITGKTLTEKPEDFENI